MISYVLSLFFASLLMAETLHASVPDPEQAIGSYTWGQLRNGDSLPDVGSGFLKIFRTLERRWATSDLVKILTDVAHEMAIAYPGKERLQVGDLSREKGGPIQGHPYEHSGLNHVSHQNGLDVDLVYFRTNRFEDSPEVNEGFKESFVRNGKVTRNFDLVRNFELVRRLHQTGRINRIFVDAAIKQAFCQHVKKTAGVNSHADLLRRLRTWARHDDHLHVRITCPKSSPRCVPQAELPPGTGC